MASLSEVLAGGVEASVASVSAGAGVGRSTFYTHFTSLEDLVDFAIGLLFSDLAPIDHERRSARSLSRLEISRMGLNELLDALLGNQLLVAFAANSPASERLRTHLVEAMATSLQSAILVERPGASETFVTITSRYIAAGVIAVVIEALEEPRRFTRDE
ncbi:MAG: TetR/AcrR family transcriptional regulator, partial [Leucobacter sp.]|nr:TetR/AcrR family transcriptional regulator [Leucobacter sp.]